MIDPEDLTPEACARNDRGAKRLLVLILCSVPLLFGCAWLRAETEGPCPPTDLTAIEARFVVEATRACRAEGAKTLTECKAFPAIRDKYRAERDAYVECKP